jgi:hypothetical protein
VIDERFFPLPAGITDSSTLADVVKVYVHEWYMACARHGDGPSGINKWLASETHTGLLARMAMLADGHTPGRNAA